MSPNTKSCSFSLLSPTVQQSWEPSPNSQGHPKDLQGLPYSVPEATAAHHTLFHSESSALCSCPRGLVAFSFSRLLLVSSLNSCRGLMEALAFSRQVGKSGWRDKPPPWLCWLLPQTHLSHVFLCPKPRSTHTLHFCTATLGTRGVTSSWREATSLTAAAVWWMKTYPNQQTKMKSVRGPKTDLCKALD